jgi:DNA-binding transcriptional regulator YiaG
VKDQDPLEQALQRARARRQLPVPEIRRHLREGVGLRQADIASALKVAASTFARWERGERVPRGGALTKYLGVLDRLRAEAAR